VRDGLHGVPADTFHKIHDVDAGGVDRRLIELVVMHAKPHRVLAQDDCLPVVTPCRTVEERLPDFSSRVFRSAAMKQPQPLGRCPRVRVEGIRRHGRAVIALLAGEPALGLPFSALAGGMPQGVVVALVHHVQGVAVNGQRRDTSAPAREIGHTVDRPLPAIPPGVPDGVAVLAPMDDMELVLVPDRRDPLGRHPLQFDGLSPQERRL